VREAACFSWRSFTAGFYRTFTGAEVDLVLEIPGQGIWAIEIKRGLGARPDKGFHIACDDLQVTRRFLVNSGKGRYPMGHGVEAVGLWELASELAGG
jgi:hypothetical protein